MSWYDDYEEEPGVIIANVVECPGCGAIVAAHPGEVVAGCEAHTRPARSPSGPAFLSQDQAEIDDARAAADEYERDYWKRGDRR